MKSVLPYGLELGRNTFYLPDDSDVLSVRSSVNGLYVYVRHSVRTLDMYDTDVGAIVFMFYVCKSNVAIPDEYGEWSHVDSVLIGKSMYHVFMNRKMTGAKMPIPVI